MGAPGNLRFSVTPTVTAPGSMVTVTSIDPCPIPAGATAATATVEEVPQVSALAVIPGPAPPGTLTPPPQAVLAPGPFFRPAQVPVQTNGSWSEAIPLSDATGIQTITASCAIGDSNPYAAYESVQITVRTEGAGYWFAWSDGSVTRAEVEV